MKTRTQLQKWNAVGVDRIFLSFRREQCLRHFSRIMFKGERRICYKNGQELTRSPKSKSLCKFFSSFSLWDVFSKERFIYVDHVCGLFYCGWVVWGAQAQSRAFFSTGCREIYTYVLGYECGISISNHGNIRHANIFICQSLALLIFLLQRMRVIRDHGSLECQCKLWTSMLVTDYFWLENDAYQVCFMLFTLGVKTFMNVSHMYVCVHKHHTMVRGLNWRWKCADTPTAHVSTCKDACPLPYLHV